MPYNFEVNGPTGIISAEPGEPITRPSAERFFSEAADLARNASVSRMLIDARKVRVDLNIMQRFEFGTLVAQIFKGLKIAFVTEPPLYDSQHFGEDVAYNRGATVREFQVIGDRDNLSRKKGRNHETIYNHCYYRVLAYRFYTSSPAVLWMGSCHKWDDFTYMDKCAWLFNCIGACIDAVARISEIRTARIGRIRGFNQLKGKREEVRYNEKGGINEAEQNTAWFLRLACFFIFARRLRRLVFVQTIRNRPCSGHREHGPRVIFNIYL